MLAEAQRQEQLLRSSGIVNRKPIYAYLHALRSWPYVEYGKEDRCTYYSTEANTHSSNEGVSSALAPMQERFGGSACKSTQLLVVLRGLFIY